MQIIVSRDILASNSRVDFASCTMINLSYVPTLAHGSHEIPYRTKFSSDKIFVTDPQNSSILSDEILSDKVLQNDFMVFNHNMVSKL